MKREHGEAQTSGAKTVAAPATVSGEQAPRMPLTLQVGKAGACEELQARRPAIRFFSNRTGVFREDMMADDDTHIRKRGPAICFPTLSNGKAEHDGQT